MRIRRRPQAQAQALALIPSPLYHPSDPSTAPPQPPPSNSLQLWLPEKEEVEARKSGELHRPNPNADLRWDEPSPPAHPQPLGNNVVGRSQDPSAGGAQRQGAAAAGHTHGSLENGHGDEHRWPVINAGEERLVNGAMPVTSPTVVAVHAKEGIKTDGTKRRRGPAVLLEGSRCSRVNGRGWRCSQPTLVGYSLCEHHLGKGRQSRSANGGGGRSTAGGPKLGRTEPASSRKSVATVMAVVAVPPGATEPAAHLTADQFD